MLELQQLCSGTSLEGALRIPGGTADRRDACGCYLKLESLLAAFLPQLQGKTVSRWQMLVPLSPGQAHRGQLSNRPFLAEGTKAAEGEE